MSSVRRSSFIVSLAVVGSRLFGLVREAVFAGLCGAKLLDCYYAAFQIPNLMRDMFAEGALSTAFTATFTKMWTKVGEARAWELANRLFSVVLVVIGLICLIGILLSGPIVLATNFGFTAVEGKFELTVSLTRILFPFILLVSLASVIMGMLNSRNIFAIPASASTAFNIVSVISALILAFTMDPQHDWLHPHFGERAVYGVAMGVLIGGLAQIGIQLPSLRRLGFKARWVWGKDEALKDVWRLMWPSIIAGAAIQVNVIVNGMFASEIDGARSWLTWAFRLVQFPIGVFGVSVATATLPAIARHHAMGDMPSFGKTAAESLRLALFLTLPASVGLAALAPELISVIYQRGQFTTVDTLQTALALRAYCLGLAGYSLTKILNPCFQALGEPKVPLRVNGIGILVNLVMNFFLVKILHWGHVGLAASTGCVATANCFQLAYTLSTRVSLGGWREWSVFLGKLALSSSLSYGAATVVIRWLWSPQGHFPVQLMAVLCSVMVGTVAYFSATIILGIAESRMAVQLVKRRLSNSR
jgi:putative peptidoglycan lipid II flippase